jgi:hypothetical protein
LIDEQGKLQELTSAGIEGVVRDILSASARTKPISAPNALRAIKRLQDEELPDLRRPTAAERESGFRFVLIALFADLIAS